MVYFHLGLELALLLGYRGLALIYYSVVSIPVLVFFCPFLALEFSLLTSQSQTETAYVVFPSSLIGLPLRLHTPYESGWSWRLDCLRDLFFIFLVVIFYPLLFAESTWVPPGLLPFFLCCDASLFFFSSFFYHYRWLVIELTFDFCLLFGPAT